VVWSKNKNDNQADDFSVSSTSLFFKNWIHLLLYYAT
jgi:hypothetical protein